MRAVGLGMAILFFLGVVLAVPRRTAEDPVPSEAVRVSEFRLKLLRVGNAILEAEVASTAEEKAHGLSGRTSLPIERGMLFIFDVPQEARFWNKDTLIPLEVIWIVNNEVVGFSFLPAQEAGESSVVVTSPQAVDKVLEVNAGWARVNGIEVGDTVSIKNKK